MSFRLVELIRGEGRFLLLIPGGGCGGKVEYSHYSKVAEESGTHQGYTALYHDVHGENNEKYPMRKIQLHFLKFDLIK